MEDLLKCQISPLVKYRQHQILFGLSIQGNSSRLNNITELNTEEI